MFGAEALIVRENFVGLSPVCNYYARLSGESPERGIAGVPLPFYYRFNRLIESNLCVLHAISPHA
jgi:hypothetical protein